MKKLIGMFVLSLLPVSASAQNAIQAAHQTSVAARVSNQLSQIAPEDLIHTMLRSNVEMVTARLEAYTEPDNIKLIAKFSYDLFQALIAQGFTEEQALKIVKSIGLPVRR